MAKKKKVAKKRYVLPDNKGAKVSDKRTAGIRERINKKFGDVVIYDEVPTFPIFFADTGSWPLNWVASGRPLSGGFPGSRLTEIYGDPSTGKSVIIYKAGAYTTRNDGFFIIDDTENSYFDYYERWFGIDPSRRFLLKSLTIDQHFDRASALYEDLRSQYGQKHPIMVALDSSSTLMSKREWEEGFDKADSGQRAHMLHLAMRRLRAYLQEDPLLVYVVTSHKIAKFGDFFHQEDSAGGKGVKFQSSVRIDLQERGSVKHPQIENRTIGKNSAAKLMKSKLISPNRLVYIQILWDDRGLIRSHGVVDLLVNEQVVIKAMDDEGKQKTKNKKHLYCFSSDMAIEFTADELESSDELMRTGLGFIEAQEKYRIENVAPAEDTPAEEASEKGD